MSSWRAFHVHYSHVDRLILDCVHPALERWTRRLERRYWERHYAGGPNLRIRLRGSAEALESATADLVPTIERFLAEHPSPDLDSYDERRAAELLEREDAPEEDLTYRNNVLSEHSYPPDHNVLVSSEAAELMDDFRHDVMPLTGRILSGSLARREQMLRLFFLQAIVAVGDLRGGCVSWKSHWEGFAATFPVLAVIDRIRDTYRHNRETIRRHMLEVETLHAEGALERDPVLADWHQLMTSYRSRIKESLRAGMQFTKQPKTPEEAAQARQELDQHLLRDSEFVRTFWSDERFIASIQHEPGFQTPRALTNLLYNLVSFVGLNPIDKMAICYYAHRIVEEHFDCDLTDILKRNMKRMNQIHGHRFAA